MNQQLPAQPETSSSSSSAAAAVGEQDSDGGTESVGTPLTKIKGKKVTEQETSKAIESKNDEKDLDIKIGKDTPKKKPNLVLVKGKKFRKHESNKDDKEDDDDNMKKPGRKEEGQKKVRT